MGSAIDSSNIVDKLRSGACPPGSGCHPQWCACAWMEEAADEIDQLRKRGMIAGLKMAARFVAVAKNKKGIESMIIAALATIQE